MHVPHGITSKPPVFIYKVVEVENVNSQVRSLVTRAYVPCMQSMLQIHLEISI